MATVAFLCGHSVLIHILPGGILLGILHLWETWFKTLRNRVPRCGSWVGTRAIEQRLSSKLVIHGNRALRRGCHLWRCGLGTSIRQLARELEQSGSSLEFFSCGNTSDRLESSSNRTAFRLSQSRISRTRQARTIAPKRRDARRAIRQPRTWQARTIAPKPKHTRQTQNQAPEKKMKYPLIARCCRSDFVAPKLLIAGG